MDYYGCRLATCSSDRSVRIYDVKNGTQTLAADLRGHEGPVSENRSKNVTHVSLSKYFEFFCC